MKQFSAILVLAILVFGGQARRGCRRPTGNIGQLATCEEHRRRVDWRAYPTVFNGQCVKDTGERVLDAGYVALNDVNTPELCIKKCKDMPKSNLPDTIPGFKLAGVQYGYQCFCGSAVTPLWLVPKDECATPCPGNATENCGGVWHMNVFATGN
eukprot:GFUD01111255.1.p1 GENE.GFUD01111255.1~~GFUD01111255.1.p1  ORF type:complete len:161 (-),score=6.28 GFUD01111255.1:146-607(-)